MRIFPAVTLALLAFLPLATAARASEATYRSYAVEGHGSLELEVPLRWREEIGWTPGDRRPLLRFFPGEGDAFVMTLAVLPRPADASPEHGTAPWLRAVVEDSARSSLGLQDARDLLLEQIGDGPAVGWYYSVTDRAMPEPPPEGSFRVMTQGASAAGDVVLTATVLTQRAWGEELNDALRLLRTARLSDRPADPWRAPSEDVLARGGLGERYDLVIPEEFERESSCPLTLRCRRTGGLLTVTVAPGRSTVRAELQRLRANVERRSPGSWTVRRSGPALLAGKAAARLVVIDELRDEEATAYALPLEDAVLTVTWRVHPTRAREADARLAAILGSLQLK